MASDRRLSKHFVLSEFPGWQEASEADVSVLLETVNRVLEPTREVFGPVVPTSWLRPDDPSGAAHRDPGTVDYVTPSANMEEVFEWSKVELIPGGAIGELEYDPDPENEHLHVTRWDVGGRGEVIRKTADGYEFGAAVGLVPATLVGLSLLVLALVAFFTS